MSQNKVVLLLGSNLGNPEANIDEAVSKIKRDVGRLISITEKLKTKPVEYESNNNFCNIALELTTIFSPIELLKRIKLIECEMGRVCDSAMLGRYEDRFIDIDIVSFNNIVFVSKRLILPHKKHLHEREFSRELLNILNSEGRNG